MKPRKLRPKVLLDIGCGLHKERGFVGMDKRRVPGVDIVWDVERFPWPIKAASVHLAAMTHVVEHIKPWLQIQLLDECWRILEPGGILMIKTPYGGSQRYYQDPTHCAPWTEITPMYFVPGGPLYEIYRPKPWELKQCAWDVKFDIEIAMKKLPVSAMERKTLPKGKEYGSWRPEGYNVAKPEKKAKR